VIAERAATGTLRIAASLRDGRTVVDTLRQDGLARCSRPLADAAWPGAARLVVSQLGPGFVRGDRFETYGELGAGAVLTVAAQSAARYFGGGPVSHARASWIVGPGATLVLLGEPAIAYAGASHRSSIDVTLAPGATFAAIDLVAPHEPFARVVTSLRVFRGTALALVDRLHLTPARLGRDTFGTAFSVRSGLTPGRSEALLAAMDAFAARFADAGARVRLGVGGPATGAVLVRAKGARSQDVREALTGALQTMIAEHRRAT
jgi:urease accessory protein UreH